MKLIKSILLVAALFLSPVHAASAQSAKKAVTPTSPRGLVAELYRQSGRKHSPFFQTRSRALVDKYFERHLGDLIWKDAITSKNEVGLLDGDPLYNAQDMEIKHFVIHEPVMTKGRAEVKVTFENFGQKKEITFLLSSGAGSSRWKIWNIKYDDGSDLLGILKGGN
jgi:hypothetical protein